MITVVSDTHGTDGHRLAGRTLTAVREAALVVHAGDFVTEDALAAFEAQAGAEAGSGTDTPGEGERFVAVAGNNDGPAVRDRLGDVAVADRAGVRFVVVHGHDHDATRLSLLARQEGADVVVVGHSHRPGWEPAGAGEAAVLNPGSHADPRRYRPAHAELEPTAEGLRGRLVTPDGEVFSEFDLAAGRA